APVAIRFHLHPAVKASLALDRKSVLLQAPTGPGWWLRNDAAEVRIEPSVHFVEGQPRAVQQVTLRGHFHADKGGRVRWKLLRAE
ncbi:MAG: heparinase II/III domain-containing protein, partial [Caulobacteraceae bacterium]